MVLTISLFVLCGRPFFAGHFDRMKRLSPKFKEVKEERYVAT
jgi:hypothetical protein